MKTFPNTVFMLKESFQSIFSSKNTKKKLFRIFHFVSQTEKANARTPAPVFDMFLISVPEYDEYIDFSSDSGTKKIVFSQQILKFLNMVAYRFKITVKHNLRVACTDSITNTSTSTLYRSDRCWLAMERNWFGLRLLWKKGLPTVMLPRSWRKKAQHWQWSNDRGFLMASSMALFASRIYTRYY